MNSNVESSNAEVQPARIKVFISWSGTQSKEIAKAMREWIPQLTSNVEPWMSEVDIDAGSRWNIEVSEALEETRFGILCLTKENLTSPWLLFEAGALSKSVDNTYVIPFLFNIDVKEINKGPLSQLQSVNADKDGTEMLVKSLNEAVKCEYKELAHEEDVLINVFNTWWPDLERRFTKITDIKEKIKTEA